MTAAPSRFLGSHFRSVCAGPFEIGLSRATVPRQDVPEHGHDDAHFILAVDAGYLSRAFGDAGQPGRGMDLIYNPPGTEHGDCFFETGGRFLSISVPAALAPRASKPLHLQQRAATGVAAGLIGPCAEGAVHAGLMLEDRLLNLLGCVSEGHSAGVTPRWLTRADELIHARATEQRITVSALAEELRIHPVYFARAYRAARGHGPAVAIHARRVNAATAMLSREVDLAGIAFACGFADQSHMSRSVRKTFGAPPRALRAAFR